MLYALAFDSPSAWQVGNVGGDEIHRISQKPLQWRKMLTNFFLVLFVVLCVCVCVVLGREAGTCLMHTSQVFYH
jgi:hypothetical protein